MHYSRRLEIDDKKRNEMPTSTEISAEYERIMARIDAGEINGGRDQIGMINSYTDYELMLIARKIDEKARVRRLSTLRSSLALGNSTPVEADIRQYIKDNSLSIEPYSPEWRDLAHAITSAEIEALQRTAERDAGDYSGGPTNTP